MAFPHKLFVDEEIESLVAHTEDLGRGDLITYEEVAKITGFEKDSPKWKKAIQKWRKKVVEDRGIYILAERGIGYRLPEVDDQIDKSLRTAHSARRRLNHSGAITAVINTKEMSKHQKDRVAAVQEVTEAAHTTFKVEAAKRKSLFAIQPRLPQRED